jgi:single-stranded-DNA-specific exonuclease
MISAAKPASSPSKPEAARTGAVGSEAPTVLGVEQSLSGKRWRARLVDDRSALALAQRTGLPEIVARVLAARGVDSDDVSVFLNPTLKQYLPDPSILIDMDRAVAHLTRAIVSGETIAVFGDYDVDGATSSALLETFLSAVGGKPRVYIPDRIKEGYGPNAPALLKLGDEGASVVVTVDCGISAHEPLAAAANAGIDVIVVDHHVAEPKLPPAFAIINPNRLDESGQLRQLAAVGVSFLLVVALNRHLRKIGWYNDRPEPDLREWLDIVALGTVCDVVPLTGLNRAFVAQGLKVMAGRRNRGLAALADVARIHERPGAFHAAYLLGPRVNAGGRVGEAGLGARLLVTQDEGEASRIAAQLDAYNQERRDIEAKVLAEAIARAERLPASPSVPVIVAGAGWHPGVIGIVASRLVEHFGRPAFVISIDGDIGKGSGRSITGVDLGAAVIAARQAGLLVNGGGHAMAAGLTVEASKIEALRSFLGDRIGREIDKHGLRPSLGIDGSLALKAVSEELSEQLETIGPYGSGNAEPRFVLPGVRIAHAEVVGGKHVRCFLTDGAGTRVGGIAFRAADRDLGKAILAARGGAMHLAGHLRINEWQGRREVRFVIEDAAFA